MSGIQSEAFVERWLELSDGASVRVCFMRPEKDGNDYRCEYSITWPDRVRNWRNFGVDGVQALKIAMQGAHIDLLSSPENKAGKLSWLGERDFGLPLPESINREDFLG